jgi:hypothetical protein
MRPLSSIDQYEVFQGGENAERLGLLRTWGYTTSGKLGAAVYSFQRDSNNYRRPGRRGQTPHNTGSVQMYVTAYLKGIANEREMHMMDAFFAWLLLQPLPTPKETPKEPENRNNKLAARMTHTRAVFND